MAITKKDVKKAIGAEIKAWKTAPGKHKKFLSGLLDSPKSEMSPKEAYEEEKAIYWDLRAKLDVMNAAEKKSEEADSIRFAIGNFDENFVARFHLDREQQRAGKQEGGALMVPPEMEEIPTDTYTPKEQTDAEANQVSDDRMEDEFVDYVVGTALDDDEQSYLTSALAADERLSEIFDKVVETASEFTGDGPVEGPGTGVSDSIPARLSDGEFVITKKATDQIGSDNLQSMMDEAERAFDGGLQKKKKYILGGTVEEDEDVKSLLGEKDEEEIKKQMINANRFPSVVS